MMISIKVWFSTLWFSISTACKLWRAVRAYQRVGVFSYIVELTPVEESYSEESEAWRKKHGKQGPSQSLIVDQ